MIEHAFGHKVYNDDGSENGKRRQTAWEKKARNTAEMMVHMLQEAGNPSPETVVVFATKVFLDALQEQGFDLRIDDDGNPVNALSV